MAKIRHLPDLELLCKFASNDPTRPQLGLINKNDDLQGLCATNGHILMVNTNYCSNFQSNFDASVFLKTGQVLYNTELKYPDVRSIIPELDGYTQNFTFSVPEYLEKLSKNKKAAQLYFDKDFNCMLNKPKDAVLSLDARYLGLLAGRELRIKFKNNSSPLYFSLSEEIYGLIMPMRL